MCTVIVCRIKRGIRNSSAIPSESTRNGRGVVDTNRVDIAVASVPAPPMYRSYHAQIATGLCCPGSRRANGSYYMSLVTYLIVLFNQPISTFILAGDQV